MNHAFNIDPTAKKTAILQKEQENKPSNISEPSVLFQILLSPMLQTCIKILDLVPSCGNRDDGMI
jgi:hypothetical protein